VDSAGASRIAHGDLTLYNPLSDAAFDGAISLLELAPGARVLDVACGFGEVLRRIAAGWEIAGVGYDTDAELIARGAPDPERRASRGARAARARGASATAPDVAGRAGDARFRACAAAPLIEPSAAARRIP
jgi:SAM-dependent methyltransferase